MEMWHSIYDLIGITHDIFRSKAQEYILIYSWLV